jgi:hypothetical protein
MANELDPPPSIVEFIKDNPRAEAIWKTWLNNLYEWLQDSVKKDFFFEVSQGNVAGYSSTIISASNPDIDTTEEDIWNVGGNLTYLTSADTFRIAAGGNAADAAAGTGAREVVFVFLDSDYNEVTEVIATAGASASSATSSTGLRFLRAYVSDVGSNGSNVGAITIEAVTAGTTHGLIQAGKGISKSGHYTIPAGKTGYVIGENFSCVKASGGPGSGAAGVQIFGWIRYYDTGSTNNYQSWLEAFHVGIIEGGNNPTQFKEFSNEELPEKTDVRVSAISDTSNMEVDARLYIVLKDN